MPESEQPRRRLALALHPTSWQGPVGVVCIVVAVALLASWQWALLVAGVLLVAAAGYAAWDERRRLVDDSPAGSDVV